MDHLSLSSFHSHLNNFITAAKQYSLSHNESSFNTVLCSLQIIGQPSNQFVFDPKNLLIQEFYIYLHEIMSNNNNESDIIWAAINVLQSMVKQGFFYNSKLNNYKSTLILIKLLKNELSLDRKIKILKLLQELTYGVKLQWHEGYLSELIILLVKWISSEDKDLISFSLGVLVNVSCKNKFAMFTLVKYVNSKSFMRLLLKLQSDDIFIKVQVYKLLLILEQVSGQLPLVDVSNLIDVTFIVLEEGLKLKNLFVLRHAVDFFIDISEHSSWKNPVFEYPNYQQKLNNILEVMNTCKSNEKLQNNCDISYQSFGLVLQFIQHIIQLKNDDCIVLYPKIIFHIFHWSQSLDLHHQSMLILQTIIINVRNYNNCLDQNLQCDILEKLEGSLDILINFLLQHHDNFEKTSDISGWDNYTIYFKLFQEMLKMQNLYKKIEEKLSISSLRSIFHSMALVDIKDLNNLQSIMHVFIEALCFLSDLVAKNPTWMPLYSEVLNQKQVYSILAFIIYNGPKNMKQKVLDLVTKFSQQSTFMLSDCLEEMEQISSAEVNKMINLRSEETEIKPLCSFDQEKQLQIYIDKLENMFNSNEIRNLKTSNVIKLYQYKINVLNQTEVWLKQSLKNTSEEITNLNCKINSLNCESLQINQMLLENHQIIDELTSECSELKKKLNDVTEQFSTTSNNFAKLSQNYESKCKIIQERDSTIKNLENKFEELQIVSNEMKTNLMDQLKNEKTENELHVSKLEQQLIDKQSIINEKVEEINNKTSFIRNLENLILEKDRGIDELRKELQEQQRVREMISQMLAATSKPQFKDS